MAIKEIKIPQITEDEIRNKPYYTALSVELGNTTIKSIIITTNLKTANTYMLEKLVKLTRDIRNPKQSEKAFGKTIWGKPLSQQAIEESVEDIIKESVSNANLIVDDIDFVVRSTGVTAVFSNSEEVGQIIKALANGCMNAGIKPSNMTPAFSKNNIPEHVRDYSFINNVAFDGTVVSVSSPKSGMVANAMEGELVTAGIKLASKTTNIQYRNPVISIDMGTTLAGQVVNNNKPYANLICNYCGIAGGISDIILRGCKIVKDNEATIDCTLYENNDIINKQKLHEHTLKLHKYIDIMEVPYGSEKFGGVNVDTVMSNEANVKLIGSQIKNEDKLIKTFQKIIDNQSKNIISYLIDDLYAYYIKRLIDTTDQLKLISDNITLGITGRSGITGHKPELIYEYLNDKIDNILFVNDGLALGAVMMARCMNSLGTPAKPVGGSKNGMCIMQQRIHKQNK